MTEAEKKLWRRLRARQFHNLKFRKQTPIENYIVDFLCFEKRLIVEIDGGQHNNETDQPRTDFLESKEFLVLRFWNNDVLNNLDGVLEEMENILQIKHPPPTPPSGRGESFKVPPLGRGNK